MKNPLTALLPALALLALGGCAGTAALSSSEDDGVYYSSQDRTTAIVSAAPAPASPDEAANPDYNGNTNAAGSSARQGNSGSDQYYDDTYTYMQGVPAYGPGLSYYTPYSPYTSLSYGSAWGGGGYGSPYGIYDPFYSPYYSPFGYGYGSGISISIGFGRPWGYGGYGYGGFGRPYYGYGGGFYDPFYYSSPFYGGYYGRGGYYGNGYYGSNFGYGNRYYGNDNGRPNRASGPRRDRSAEGRYSTGGVSSPNAPTTGGNPTGGRMRSEGRVVQNNPTTQPMTPATTGGRTRGDAVTATPMVEPTRMRDENGYNRPQRMSRNEQPVYRDMDQPTAQPANTGQILSEDTRSRRRSPEVVTERDPMQPQLQPQAQPQEGQRRRGGFLQNVVTQPGNNGGQVTEQQRQRQRAYDQPRPERSYEQPQQRTYEQPQQRSYEQPQRASQPSYSAPSNSGGGGGGGRGRGRAD